MGNIELVEIRATISIGGGDIIVRTPYIQSFNVRKARGQSSSFDASLKVQQSKLTSNNLGGEVVIYAGTKGSQNKIFTGIIKKATIAPCWEDPGLVIFNISGVDCLSILQGKKYTRRCRASKSVWVSIDSVARDGLRDGKFAYDTDTVLVNSGQNYKRFPEQFKADELAKNTSRPAKTRAETIVKVNITHIPDSGPTGLGGR